MAKKRKKKMKSDPLVPEKKAKKKNANYVDNDKMYSEICKYHSDIQQFNTICKNLQPSDQVPNKPKVSDYIGSCIMLIAQRLATKPNFANYTYRDEMVGDAIENCLTYIDNFDPTKSKNPFAYFTQIIYFAFVRRITKEKKQTFVKMKMLEKMDTKGNIRRLLKDGIASADEFYEKEMNPNSIYADMFDLSDFDVKYFEKKSQGKAFKKKTRKSKKSNLDEYFQ